MVDDINLFEFMPTVLGRKIEEDPLDFDKLANFVRNTASVSVFSGKTTDTCTIAQRKRSLDIVLTLNDSEEQTVPLGRILAYELVRGYYCYELNSKNFFEERYGEEFNWLIDQEADRVYEEFPTYFEGLVNLYNNFTQEQIPFEK